MFISFRNLQTTANVCFIGQTVGPGGQDKWLLNYGADNNLFYIHLNGSVGNQWIYSDEVELNENEF